MRFVRTPFVLLLLLLCATACQSQAPEFAKVGERAPAIDLPLASGDARVTLAQQQGKVVLVNFWATWCIPCRAEMPALQRLAADLSNEKFTLLMIDLQEDSASIDAFRREIDFTLPVLLDSEGDVTRSYGVRGLPATFLIDSNGTLVRQRLGPLSQRAEQEWSDQWLAAEIRALLPR